jgi:hypothetical protein
MARGPCLISLGGSGRRACLLARPESRAEHPYPVEPAIGLRVVRLLLDDKASIWIATLEPVGDAVAVRDRVGLDRGQSLDLRLLAPRRIPGRATS